MKEVPHNSKDILDTLGLKKTDARIALLDLLATATKPLSTKEIAIKLTKKNVDRVTVYRVLEIFISKGIVRSVDLGTRENLYEITDTKEDHHHMICLSCKKVSDFTGCNSQELIAQALKQTKDFKSISHHSFDLFGLCTTCAKK